MDDGIINLSNRILKTLRRYPKISRVDLMRKTHMPAAELNAVLDYLTQAGEIEIVLNGKVKMYPSRDGTEMYVYKGNDIEEDQDEGAPDGK